jgi:hypothetical protein
MIRILDTEYRSYHNSRVSILYLSNNYTNSTLFSFDFELDFEPGLAYALSNARLISVILGRDFRTLFAFLDLRMRRHSSHASIFKNTVLIFEHGNLVRLCKLHVCIISVHDVFLVCLPPYFDACLQQKNLHPSLHDALSLHSVPFTVSPAHCLHFFGLIDGIVMR